MILHEQTFILLYPKQNCKNWKSPLWMTRQLLLELSEPYAQNYKFSMKMLQESLLNKSVNSFASTYKNQDPEEFNCIKNFYKKLGLDLNDPCVDETTAKIAGINIFNSAMTYIPENHLKII